MYWWVINRIYSINLQKEEKYCPMWLVRVLLMHSWQYACTSSALSNKAFLIVPSRSYFLISRTVTNLFFYLITLIDQKVFNRFKVNRLIVRKMKLVEYMFCKLASIYLTTNCSNEPRDSRPCPWLLKFPAPLQPRAGLSRLLRRLKHYLQDQEGRDL